MSKPSNSTISNLHLKNHETLMVSDHMQREQKTAIEDLLNNSFFQPLNDNAGPYEVIVSIEDNRLVLRITNTNKEDLSTLVLSLRPYHRLIQDYFMMISSYEEARHNAGHEKLEAIDMGRRGLHNEGAELLKERLQDKIDMDFDTARRFFTLICSLHRTNVRLTV